MNSYVVQYVQVQNSVCVWRGEDTDWFVKGRLSVYVYTCAIKCEFVCVYACIHFTSAGFPVHSLQIDTVDDGCAAVICFHRPGCFPRLLYYSAANDVALRKKRGNHPSVLLCNIDTLQVKRRGSRFTHKWRKTESEGVQRGWGGALFKGTNIFGVFWISQPCGQIQYPSSHPS